MYPLLTKARLITLSVTSFILFILSIVLAFVIIPIVVDSQIDKNIQLVRGTDQWHRFKQLPFDLTFNITLFDVTNAQKVIEEGENPVLKEKGPYVFDEVIKKTNIKYKDEDDSISYDRQMKFHFNQLKSGSELSYDDKITMINPVYLAVIEISKNININIPFINIPRSITNCLNAMFMQKLLLTVSVRELLFDGIRVCDFNSASCKVLGISICTFFLDKTKLIERVTTKEDDYLKLSFLNYKTIEPDGVYEIKTGISDITEVGSITKWNDKTYTNFWVQNRMNNSCDLVKGTDGTIFPPHVTKDTELSVYSTDICRKVDIFYTGEDTYRDIEGYIFKTKPSLFYSSSANPSEDCFCDEITLNTDGEKSCFLNGVMDLYPCIGVPVLVSYPHFLHADKTYLKNLEGDIAPDENKHSLYMLVDKYTGVPLQAHKRVQMNMISRPFKDFESLTSKLPRTILPLFWIDEGIDLPDIGLDLLNSLLYDTLNLLNILQWVFIGVTLGLTIVFSLLLFYQYYNCFKK